MFLKDHQPTDRGRKRQREERVDSIGRGGYEEYKEE
jgi:hypothetical protein